MPPPLSRIVAFHRLCPSESESVAMIGPARVRQSKPEWWTEAWDLLKDTHVTPGKWVQPVSPIEFKEDVRMDVCGFDQQRWQCDTDPTTSQEILPDEGNELLGGIVGVVWSNRQVTMTRCAAKDTDPRMVFLRNFSQYVTLCPEGATLMFESYSDDLVSEYDQIMIRKDLRGGFLVVQQISRFNGAA
jgi:hypothetical protein